MRSETLEYQGEGLCFSDGCALEGWEFTLKKRKAKSQEFDGGWEIPSER